VAFGLITKLIPQMNIMIVAFPVQIIIGLVFFGISLIGLVFFGISLNVLLRFMERYLAGLSSLLINAMSWLKV